MICSVNFLSWLLWSSMIFLLLCLDLEAMPSIFAHADDKCDCYVTSSHYFAMQLRFLVTLKHLWLNHLFCYTHGPHFMLLWRSRHQYSSCLGPPVHHRDIRKTALSPVLVLYPVYSKTKAEVFVSWSGLQPPPLRVMPLSCPGWLVSNKKWETLLSSFRISSV